MLSSSAAVIGDSEAVTVTTACHLRRRTIPPRPNYSINLWSIMKNCIGKELSKIPMPVRLNLTFTTDHSYPPQLSLAILLWHSFLQHLT